ncbi:MAG: type VI secretion system baseplate subunit TssG [Gemmatimonadaceae bacterium]|nr:type VI secretion system baseplate subunit TssG [Gemmatimonadaceae bacterium]
MTSVSTEQRLRDLERDAAGYGFSQLIRLLSRARAQRAPVGGWAGPTSEVVRFTVPPSLAFPASEVAGMELPEGDDEPVRMDVRFFGLTGPQGVLPHSYTSHAATRARARDTAFRDFLDLFHHRALSLFHRAWEHHRPSLAAERGGADRLREHLDDLAGIGTEAVRRTADTLADSMPYYAGLFALRTRPAHGLAQLIGDYFDVPTSVDQFVGEWRPLGDGGQLCLDDDGIDGRLGSAVIGDAVYDPHARVRLRLGPLTRTQFDSLLPQGRFHEPLRRLVRLYADDQVGVDVQLVLRRTDAPQAALSSANAPTLGFGTWLRSRPVTRDPDDVLLALC